MTEHERYATCGLPHRQSLRNRSKIAFQSGWDTAARKERAVQDYLAKDY